MQSKGISTLYFKFVNTTAVVKTSFEVGMGKKNTLGHMIGNIGHLRYLYHIKVLDQFLISYHVVDHILLFWIEI